MPHFEDIYDHAVAHYGLVTNSEAKRMGVHRKELLRWIASGRMERCGRGVYRIVHYVPTGLDRYAEALAMVGCGSAIVGESVLAMHDLALVNPAFMTVATPRRVRKSLPGWIHLVRMDKDMRTEDFEGILCQALPDAIRGCRNTVMGSRLADAVRDAKRKGLLGQVDAHQLEIEFPL